MDTLQVGKRLVELCRAGEHLQAVDELYSPDIVSVEVMGNETIPARMEGIQAIRGKNEWWLANHEIHHQEVRGPYPHGDRFIVQMSMDITPKSGPMAGQRFHIEEAGLYTVKDGKVVHEEFFCDVSGRKGGG